MFKFPKVIGHRGAAEYAPENTLNGIHAAADIDKLEWVELDVKLTKDQVPIIFHDDTLERTTNGSGNVRDHTLAEIKELDAGSWFSDDFIGVQIPTLEEAADVLLERDLGLSLEIKPCVGLEKETAEIALDVLSNIWDNKDKVLISSYEPVSLEAAMDLVQEWRRGFIIGDDSPDPWLNRIVHEGRLPKEWESMAKHLQVEFVAMDHKLFLMEEFEQAIAAGYPVIAFTVNEQKSARELQSLGVHGFYTDNPDVIMDAVLTVH